MPKRSAKPDFTIFDVSLFTRKKSDRDIRHALAHIIHRQEKIMATLKDVQAALAQAAADATAEKAEVATAIQALTDQVKALKDQIASGTVVTAADLDGIVTAINGIDAQVKDITVPVAPTA